MYAIHEPNIRDYVERGFPSVSNNFSTNTNVHGGNVGAVVGGQGNAASVLQSITQDQRSQTIALVERVLAGLGDTAEDAPLRPRWTASGLRPRALRRILRPVRRLPWLRRLLPAAGPRRQRLRPREPIHGLRRLQIALSAPRHRHVRALPRRLDRVRPRPQRPHRLVGFRDPQIAVSVPDAPREVPTLVRLVRERLRAAAAPSSLKASTPRAGQRMHATGTPHRPRASRSASERTTVCPQQTPAGGAPSLKDPKDRLGCHRGRWLSRSTALGPSSPGTGPIRRCV